MASTSLKNKIYALLRTQSLVRDILTTTGWSAAGKAAGFLVPFFVASWFGISGETDAFFFAYGLILFLASIFAPVFEGIVVPFIAEIRSRDGDVSQFVGRLLGLSGVGLLVFSGIMLALSRPLLSLVTRFDESSLTLISSVLLETAPLVILLTWSGILAGTLNAFKKFPFPAVSPALRAIVSLGVIYFGKDSLGVHAIALGYIIGEVARLALLFGVVKRLDLFSVRPRVGLSRDIIDFLKTASFQAVGMVAAGLTPVVDKTMASWLGEGSVSILYYADRLYMIPVTFMTAGLIVTLLSHWSANYYQAGSGRLKREVNQAVKWVGLIALAVMVLFLLIRMPVVRLIFRKKIATPAQISEVGRVWLFYLLGYVPFILGRIYVRAHLVLKNTRPLMISAFCIIGINILFNYILMRVLGVAGIALATTIAALFSLIYLSTVFYRRLKRGVS